ncbi:unnamed protein product, partial [Oppiella nova]
ESKVRRFLKKSGLKDIHFILINSKDLDAKQKLKDLTQKVSFGVYQENGNELVWNALDGGKDDMFIYDRCGLLTYYIPFPLSIIHAQQPILQAALLSTYFDNPCGESCDSIPSDTSPINTTLIMDSVNITTESSLSSGSDPLNNTSFNVTFDETFPEGLNESKVFESNVTTIDLRDENVIVFETTEASDSVVVEDGSGSGSGDAPIEEVLEISTESIGMTNGSNSSLKEEEWKTLEMINGKDNRSDKDIFDDIYN